MWGPPGRVHSAGPGRLWARWTAPGFMAESPQNTENAPQTQRQNYGPTPPCTPELDPRAFLDARSSCADLPKPASQFTVISQESRVKGTKLSGPSLARNHANSPVQKSPAMTNDKRPSDLSTKSLVTSKLLLNVTQVTTASIILRE